MPVSNRNRAFTTAVFALHATHGCSLRLVSDFMDDANMPSLLSLPIYGYLNQTDEIYARTRAAVLSSRNPWSSNGTAGAGVGSPHTGAHAACERRLPQGCLAQQHGYACARLTLVFSLRCDFTPLCGSGLRKIWPIAITTAGRTATTDAEVSQALSELVNASACTGLVHESFDMDDVTDFTRPWFAWANSCAHPALLGLSVWSCTCQISASGLKGVGGLN